ncbi:MAG: AbrB/MazE/SpoVT family DNA-binding domain-containing protein [Fusobacteriaceae bacterium]|jgi:antitoxin component of MazEF toxin-antitoxin module|nr:AbrB/MazE/SpoVT family DNA-binding domain-containing protein [Fusobacteriaceae bacterium]
MPKIRKIGNSCGIILPNAILSRLGITVDDEVEAFIDGNNIKIQKKCKEEEILKSWFKKGPINNKENLLEFEEDDRIWVEN